MIDKGGEGAVQVNAEADGNHGGRVSTSTSAPRGIISFFNDPCGFADAVSHPLNERQIYEFTRQTLM